MYRDSFGAVLFLSFLLSPFASTVHFFIYLMKSISRAKGTRGEEEEQKMRLNGKQKKRENKLFFRNKISI